MSAPTTFVSTIFYPEKYNVQKLLLQFAESDIPLVIFVPNSIIHIVQKFIEQYENTDPDIFHAIRIRDKDALEPFICLNDEQSESLQLPQFHNAEKDTMTHMWNMHSKIYYVHSVVQDNPFKSQSFAWIDFDIQNIFYESTTTWSYLRTQYGLFPEERKQLFLPQEPVYGLNTALENHIWMPGCLSQRDKEDVDTTNFKNHVCWRFCGSFFLGTSHSIKKLYTLYREYFVQFLLKDNVMTWEVNFWAWLEATTELWRPKWYSADHNDSLIRIPDVFSFHVAKESPESFRTYTYAYPNMSPFRPGSASFVEYNGEFWLNTRYVNYWIYPTGYYWYPDDESIIRTKNVLSRLVYSASDLNNQDTLSDSILIPINFQEIYENLSQPKTQNVFSEGIEDLRLYVSTSDELMCIGTTSSYSHEPDCRSRMIIGQYDISQQCIHNCITVRPPEERDTWCEKNWAPIPLSNNKDGFIYQWYPLEIGEIHADNDNSSTVSTLDIVHRYETPKHVFQKLKGSTPFIPWKHNGWIGLVHGNEDTVPRQYYHRLVILDRETYNVVQYTEAFCFIKPSVEFCIGMKYREETDIWVFWISQMDREPTMIEIQGSWFYDKWIEHHPV